MIALNQVYNLDCKEILSQVDKDVVLVTDPPYGINLDLKWLSEMNLADGKNPNKCDEKIANDSEPFDATHLFNFDRRLIFGFPYIHDAKATGWIVWDKQPKVAERCITTPVEMASTTLRKGFDIIRVMWGGFYREEDVHFDEIRYEHPTQKPLKLMMRLIEKYTDINDVIFDPYCGTGTTLVSAKMLGRRYIGCEIEPKYFKITMDRLSKSFIAKKAFGGGIQIKTFILNLPHFYLKQIRFDKTKVDLNGKENQKETIFRRRKLRRSASRTSRNTRRRASAISPSRNGSAQRATRNQRRQRCISTQRTWRQSIGISNPQATRTTSSPPNTRTTSLVCRRCEKRRRTTRTKRQNQSSQRETHTSLRTCGRCPSRRSSAVSKSITTPFLFSIFSTPKTEACHQ